MRRLTSPFRTITLLLLFVLPSCLKAASIGEWTYYFSYHDATHCIPVGKTIYALYAGNLLIYDTEDSSVATPTKLNGLSEKNIVLMQDCQAAQKVVLVYSNGNIDLLHRDGTVENLPQYKNKYVGTSLNGLTIVGNDAFLATSEGIVHINVKQAEFTGFYTLKTPIYSATINGNMLYAATDAGVYRCDISVNPLDIATWSIYNQLAARQLIVMGDHLYLNTAKKGVYLLNTQTAALQQVIKTVQTSYFADSQGILFYNNNSYTPISAEANATVGKTVTLATSTHALCRTTNGTLWAAQGFEGLNAYKETDG